MITEAGFLRPDRGRRKDQRPASPAEAGRGPLSYGPVTCRAVSTARGLARPTVVVMRVLVTGGAGFIGSAIVRSLVSAGHEAVVLDALLPSAHGWAPSPPGGADGIIVADVRDREAVDRALRGIDAVCHQAAMVGLGKDFADAPDYVGCNDLGTAVLLAAMAGAGVRSLVVAGSMVVYGEGRYDCRRHGPVRPGPRTEADLDAGRFEPRCPSCETQLVPGLVDEDAPVDPRNVYATTKLAQEHLASAWARATGGRAVSLRCHNVYGPGMPRDTPYAGVASFFRSALGRGESPRVFEDGGQRRDFVHVRDVAAANVVALRAVAERGPSTSPRTTPGAGSPTLSARWPRPWPRPTGARPRWSPVSTGSGTYATSRRTRGGCARNWAGGRKWTSSRGWCSSRRNRCGRLPPGSRREGHATGRVTSKQQLPLKLRTSARPACASTMPRTIASPSPAPAGGYGLRRERRRRHSARRLQDRPSPLLEGRRRAAARLAAPGVTCLPAASAAHHRSGRREPPATGRPHSWTSPRSADGRRCAVLRRPADHRINRASATAAVGTSRPAQPTHPRSAAPPHIHGHPGPTG